MARDVELAWVAGFFDGEGNIRIHKGISDKTMINPSYRLVVQISNTDYEVMVYLQETFGGTIRKCVKAKPHHKQCWQWSIHTRQAMSFVEQIYPYLRVKKERAELARKFIDTISIKRQGPIPLSREILRLRDQYYSEMMFLNRKGIPLVA